MSKAGAKPIFSMTGFGAATEESGSLSAQVEIRSVNQRGMKLTVRSRPSLGPLEKELRDVVNARLSRGAVDVFVTVVRVRSAEAFAVREDAARAAVENLRALGEHLGLSDTLTTRDLLQIPGLFDTETETLLHESDWPAVSKALETALAQLMHMRETEGAATATRLLELVEPIQAFLQDARQYAPQVVARARERLENRIAELRPDGLTAMDSQALEREICLFADRADINEELDRLGSHVQQFRDLLTRGGEVGKRVDFLAQEFLREINTCASKASDTEIISRAIEAKLAVEKIKEQAANLE